jgi:hypothetical protein
LFCPYHDIAAQKWIILIFLIYRQRIFKNKKKCIKKSDLYLQIHNIFSIHLLHTNMKQIELTSKLVLAIIGLTSISAVLVPSYAAVKITSADIVNETIQSVDIKNGEVKAADIATDAVTADEIAGVSKLMFFKCTMDFGTIPAGGLRFADCSTPGSALDDSVVVTQKALTHNIVVVGASVGDPNIVRIGVQNNEAADITLNNAEYAVIVFHPG